MIGYSSISEAAQEAGYSIDKLISFGANEIISIGLVVGGGISILQRLEKGTGEIIEETIGGFPGHTVKISSRCLKQVEAGVKSAEIILCYYLGNDEQPIEIVKIMDLDTGKPLLVKDARLIVYDDDLATLKGLGKPNKKLPIQERRNLLFSEYLEIKGKPHLDGLTKQQIHEELKLFNPVWIIDFESFRTWWKNQAIYKKPQAKGG